MPAATDDDSPSGSPESLFGLGRLLRLGGLVPREIGGQADPTPCPTNDHRTTPCEAVEVSRKQNKPTQDWIAAAPQAAPQVTLSISPETMEVLQKLHTAGVINLGETVVNTDAKLTTWEHE